VAEIGHGQFIVEGEYKQGRKIFENDNIVWESVLATYVEYKEYGKLGAECEKILDIRL
jgi:hypothetical protein